MLRTELIADAKKGKFSKSPKPMLVASVKMSDAEQTLEMRRKAARLFCRAMIRLYLRDHGDLDLGNNLGVL